MTFWAKEKGLWFRTPQGRKAVHMEMEAYLVNIVSRTILPMGHREDVDQKGLVRFLPVYHILLHIKL